MGSKSRQTSNNVLAPICGSEVTVTKDPRPDQNGMADLKVSRLRPSIVTVKIVPGDLEIREVTLAATVMFGQVPNLIGAILRCRKW